MFNFSFLIPELHDITYAWRYLDNVASILYKPAAVFKHFSFLDLFDMTKTCLCYTAKRLTKYLDPKTLVETSTFAPAAMHVRIANTNLVQHSRLRNAVAMGLNHIPLKPTMLSACVSIVLNAFEQISIILKLQPLGFPIETAVEWLQTTSLKQLKAAAKLNKQGLRSLHRDPWSLPAVKNEIAWITDNLFYSGLDKAANNCCFVCIKHIRFMALERLSGPDFQPCKDDGMWLLRSHMLLKISTHLKDILPELGITSEALPYIMATYKLHKQKYRWLTNAANTIYSSIAHLITLANTLILESIQI